MVVRRKRWAKRVGRDIADGLAVVLGEDSFRSEI